MTPPDTEERLHKILARAGVGSLRQCEEFIRQGRVQVDRRVVQQMGVVVRTAEQEIRFDGERIRPEPMVYYLLHKPRGVVCTSRAQDERPRAVDLVPPGQRVFTVGRLDADSEGLILVTNDGALSQRLAHPRHKVEKSYLAKVAGPLEDEALRRLRGGVHLAEGRTAPARVQVRHRGPRVSTLRITIAEGMNRQVRRMIARVGLKLRSLRRVSLGPLRLGALKEGHWRPLSRQELRALRKAAATWR